MLLNHPSYGIIAEQIRLMSNRGQNTHGCTWQTRSSNVTSIRVYVKGIIAANMLRPCLFGLKPVRRRRFTKLFEVNDI